VVLLKIGEYTRQHPALKRGGFMPQNLDEANLTLYRIGVSGYLTGMDRNCTSFYLTRKGKAMKIAESNFLCELKHRSFRFPKRF
jgi:hypothetical protein